MSGTETKVKKAVVECCRNWIIVTEVWKWNDEIEDWIRFHYPWGDCGYCKEFPRMVGRI